MARVIGRISGGSNTFSYTWNPEIDGYLYLNKGNYNVSSGVAWTSTRIINNMNLNISSGDVFNVTLGALVSGITSPDKIIIVKQTMINNMGNLVGALFFNTLINNVIALHPHIPFSGQMITLYEPDIVLDTVLTFNNTQNMKSVSDGSTTITTFPNTITVRGDTTLHLSGKDNPKVTINNSQNMKQIQKDTTIYNSFPVTLNIDSNTTISASGEDHKIVTVNTTNTKPPVITNT